MRSMSMLQLVGGVAAAGVVAAGTTAFTAGSGITNTAATTRFIGGHTAVAVSGATLAGATFLVDSAGSHEDRVTGVNLTINDDSGNPIAANVTVTAAFTATGVTGGGTPTSTTPINCTYSGGVWGCVGVLDTSHYYTGVTNLAVVVLPV